MHNLLFDCYLLAYKHLIKRIRINLKRIIIREIIILIFFFFSEIFEQVYVFYA